MPKSQRLVNAVVGLLAIAVVAGCGVLGGGQPSGLGSSAATQAMALKGVTTPSQLLELQIEGKLPAPVPRAALQRQLQDRTRSRPKLALHAEAQVAIWASDTNFNYLLGQDKTGRNTVTAVDLSANSCYSPVALKVDRTQNVWVGCELTSFSGTNGAVQEYSAAGVLENRYLPSCPSNVKGCAAFSGYGFDSGIDAGGNVVASLNLYDIQVCNPSCTETLSAGFEWWSKGNPSASPRLISVGDNCSPVCGVGYMDIDASGNLWFTFSGYDQSQNFGFGLGEISSPTKKPKFTIVEPIGTYGFFGGVFASSAGQTLNVLDQQSRTILQYHLPLSASGTPFNVLGPTPLNAFGIGDPVSGGFNNGDKEIALGDTGGWFDIGKAKSNAWSAAASPNFYSGIEGAAYTPSDK